MKKLAIIFSLLAVCGFIYGACGDDNGNGGPHCEKIVTCDPACTAPQICCGTTCQDIVACDPPTCEAGVTYCDSCSGTCETIPATCDPACGANQYCDDGTCKDLPVCEPACAADEVCVP